MENQRLEHIQSFAVKQFTGRPSPFAHWLNGKVTSAEEKSVAFQFMVRKDMITNTKDEHTTGSLAKYGSPSSVRYMQF